MIMSTYRNDCYENESTDMNCSFHATYLTQKNISRLHVHKIGEGAYTFFTYNP